MRIYVYYKRAFSIFLREPAFRALAVAALVVLLAGTVFYHFTEGWSWVDSLYFCTITLATIGYGDFVPTTGPGRLFTLVYVLLGLGIVGAFLNLLVRAPLMMQDEDTLKRLHLPAPPRPASSTALPQAPTVPEAPAGNPSTSPSAPAPRRLRRGRRNGHGHWISR